jgi:Na+-driven multidrug efflux pump
LSLAVFCFGRRIIGSFLSEPNELAVNVGISYLSISIMFYFFLGMIFIFKNTLQSIGKPFYPVLSGFIELGIRCFSAIILAKSLGYDGIYYASPLAWFGGATVVFIGYYINVYKKGKDVIEDYKKMADKNKAFAA